MTVPARCSCSAPPYRLRLVTDDDMCCVLSLLLVSFLFASLFSVLRSGLHVRHESFGLCHEPPSRLLSFKR